MSTKIVNNFSRPVILDDDRNADVSWQHHLDRGSAGGVDLAYGFGTLVAMPAAGRLVFDGSMSGSGGRTATLYIDHPELDYIQFMHLSAGGVNGVYDIGATPIRSGASGFGKETYYGPHLHVHAYTKAGKRVNLFHYFSAAPAGGGNVPITNKEIDMFSFVPDAASATIYAGSSVNGKRVGIGSPYHLTLLQRFRDNGGGDKMLVGEMDIVRAYLANFEEGNDTAQILAAIQAVTISPESVKDAIKAAVSEGIGISVDAEVSDEQLDAAAERFAKLLGIRIAGGTLSGS